MYQVNKTPVCILRNQEMFKVDWKDQKWCTEIRRASTGAQNSRLTWVKLIVSKLIIVCIFITSKVWKFLGLVRRFSGETRLVSSLLLTNYSLFFHVTVEPHRDINFLLLCEKLDEKYLRMLPHFRTIS